MQTPSYEPAHCTVCGHADAALVADADDVRAELEALWAFHGRRLRPGVPVVRLLDRTAFSERPPVAIVRCRECGLVYRNPVERVRWLHEIYGRDAPTPDALRALHEAQLPVARAQAKRVRRALGRGGSALEVGSYTGAFLRAARDEGLVVEGLDVNPHINAFVRSLGLAVNDGDLAAVDPARELDAIVIWNAFDQFAEPRRELHAARGLLRPDGVLALRVPNGAVYVALRRRMARGSVLGRRAARAILAHNNLLAFPYRTGFTPASLVQLLEQTGFEVTTIRGEVLVPVGDEWTRPWARVEERVVKWMIGRLVVRQPARAPWFEVYARRRRTRIPKALVGG